MLFLLAVSLIPSDTTCLIRGHLAKNEFNTAYKLANSEILHQGTLDADNILFFLRGYANVKMKNYNQGVSDLSRFLKAEKDTNPDDLLEAYNLRCIAYLKKGNLEEAKIDADKSKNDTLIKIVTRANILHMSAISKDSSPRFSLSKYVELINICPFSEDFLHDAANIALSIGNNTLFIELVQKALKISPSNAKILEMMGRYHFSQFELDEARRYASNCINSFSDSSKCSAILKSINNFQENEKKAIKSISENNYDEAQKFIDTCKTIIKKYSRRDTPLDNQINKIYFKVLIAKDKKEDAIECLNSLIKAFPSNDEFLIQRGQLLLDFNDYTGAISDFQIVKKRTKTDTNENKEAIRLIKEASELQEKEKNVNYYTVLGLPRGANLSEVKKAYKKLAIMWHPDRFNKPLKKKEAEKKMKLINQAYDVLSDDTKKKLYDFDHGSDDFSYTNTDSNKQQNKDNQSNNNKNSNNKNTNTNKNANTNKNTNTNKNANTNKNTNQNNKANKNTNKNKNGNTNQNTNSNQNSNNNQNTKNNDYDNDDNNYKHDFDRGFESDSNDYDNDNNEYNNGYNNGYDNNNEYNFNRGFDSDYDNKNNNKNNYEDYNSNNNYKRHNKNNNYNDGYNNNNNKNNNYNDGRRNSNNENNNRNGFNVRDNNDYAKQKGRFMNMGD